MKITPVLLRTPLGSEALFPPSYYDSVSTTISRLKRKGMGSFTMKLTGESLSVTRTSDPAISADELPRVKYRQQLRSAADDLQWLAMQFDPASESYELQIVITKEGSTRRLKVPSGDMTPDMCRALVSVIEDKLKLPDASPAV